MVSSESSFLACGEFVVVSSCDSLLYSHYMSDVTMHCVCSLKDQET